MEGQSSSHDSSSRSVRRNISTTQGSSSGTRALILGGTSNTNLNVNHQFSQIQNMNMGSNVASSSRSNQGQRYSALQAYFLQPTNVGTNVLTTSRVNQVRSSEHQHINVQSTIVSTSRNPFNANAQTMVPSSTVGDSILLFGARIPIPNPAIGVFLGGTSFRYEESYSQPAPPPPAISSNIGGSSAWPVGSVRSTLEALLWDREVHNAVGFPVVARQIQETLDSYRREVVRSSVRRILQHMHRNENEAMAGDNNNFIIDLDADADDEDDELEDMPYDVNIDLMSYEEILALQEHVGSVSTGLSHEEIAAQLMVRKCGKLKKRQREEEKCCICLDEYENDQELGELDCGHYFHAKCVTEWLLVKNNCPICKSTGLAAH